jgi:hypothetical protein
MIVRGGVALNVGATGASQHRQDRQAHQRIDGFTLTNPHQIKTNTNIGPSRLSKSDMPTAMNNLAGNFLRPFMD